MSTPVLYVYSLSIWATIPQLAIAETGYPEGAIKEEVVDLLQGAQFAPDYVKLNPNATIPTLVVDGKAYTSSTEVTEYLVKHAPKKVAPGTAFIAKIHDAKIDPNFPLVSARNDEELKEKSAASSFATAFIQARQNGLEKYSKTPEGAAFKDLYDAKLAANTGLLAIYKGEAPEDAKLNFFKLSTENWKNIVAFLTVDLPAALPESGFLGGAAPGEDDFHLAAYLAHIGAILGGTADKDGYKVFEKETKQPASPKLAAYWGAWSERPSWKAAYGGGLH